MSLSDLVRCRSSLLNVTVVASLCVIMHEVIHAQPPPGPQRNRPSRQQMSQPAPPNLIEPQYKNEVSITIEGDKRVIRSNGIPDHKVGEFPNRGNPNQIAPQQYEFRIPLHPTVAGKATRAGMGPFGVAINGVVFDPSAAEWWNDDPRSGWQYEPIPSGLLLGLDKNKAHVQPNGAYHYHAIPTALLERFSGGETKMTLLGWAFDGFPIYGPWAHSVPNDPKSPLKKMKSSYRVKSGTRPAGPGGNYDGSFVEDWEYVAGSGDLDECNGRTGVTPEFPNGIYYYVLTEDWPFIPRMYRGTPDPSIPRRPFPPAGRRPPRPR
jgi:YHYH protein